MRLTLFSMLLLLFAACEPDPDKPVTPWQNLDADSLKAVMEQSNISISKAQELEIIAYTSQNNLDDMIQTGTGLRYKITEQGRGDSAQCEQNAHVRYAVSLLNDTECYSNLKTGDVEKFTICYDYVETGLHEGITYMREGDKAILIMPSVLAHGFLGDQDCIPPHSPIRIDLELVKLSK